MCHPAGICSGVRAGTGSEQPRLLSLNPAPSPSQRRAPTAGLPGFPGRPGGGTPLSVSPRKGELWAGRRAELPVPYWHHNNLFLSSPVLPTGHTPGLSILLCQWLCASASPKGQNPFPTLTQISASFLTNGTRGSPNPGLGKCPAILPPAHVSFQLGDSSFRNLTRHLQPALGWPGM